MYRFFHLLLINIWIQFDITENPHSDVTINSAYRSRAEEDRTVTQVDPGTGHGAPDAGRESATFAPPR